MTEISARRSYLSGLSPISQKSQITENGNYIFIHSTPYISVPSDVYNLLLSCRLRDLNSTSPIISFYNYTNCTLDKAANGNYTVTFRISLKDIVSHDFCSFNLSTVSGNIIYLYTCEIDQWFFATETLPDEINALLLKKTSELKISVNSSTLNELNFSSQQISDLIDEHNFVQDIATSSNICNEDCSEADPNRSVIMAGENITIQVNIEGEIASEYIMSLLNVELKLENGTSVQMADGDCTQIPPVDIPGQLQITCLMNITANNFNIEILIKLDLVEGGSRALRGGVGEETEGKGQKVRLLRSVVGPYTVCGLFDLECQKQIFSPIQNIGGGEEDAIIEDQEEEDGEGKGKSDKDKTIIGLAVGISVAIIIIIIGLIYFVRKLKRAQSQSTTTISGEMHKECQMGGITINGELQTRGPLQEEEPIPNYV